MSTDWERALTAGSVHQRDLGPRGTSITENTGESRLVCPLPEHPEWLYKEYHSKLPPADARRLARLIGLPGKLATPDKAILKEQTSWPAARVTDDSDGTIGVVMPRAPEKFSATRTNSVTGRQTTGPLDIDWLAHSQEQQARQGLPRQTLDDRLAAARSLLDVADLFERHGLVYLDWSYANAFWSTGDHSVYVIDVDGMSFGPRRQMETPNWEDPLPFTGGSAGNESDRYRVALLVARCLTGLRPGEGDLDDALSGLAQEKNADPRFGWFLYQVREVLSAPEASARPALSDLKKTLDRSLRQKTPPGRDPSVEWIDIDTIPNLRRTPPTVTPDTGPAPQAPTATGTSGPEPGTPQALHLQSPAPPFYTPPPPFLVPRRRPAVQLAIKAGKVTAQAAAAIVVLLIVIDLLRAAFH